MTSIQTSLKTPYPAEGVLAALGDASLRVDAKKCVVCFIFGFPIRSFRGQKQLNLLFAQPSHAFGLEIPEPASPWLLIVSNQVHFFFICGNTPNICLLVQTRHLEPRRWKCSKSKSFFNLLLCFLKVTSSQSGWNSGSKKQRVLLPHLSSPAASENSCIPNLFSRPICYRQKWLKNSWLERGEWSCTSLSPFDKGSQPKQIKAWW